MKQYQNLLSNIIENGRQKGDRTGTGTISIPYATLDFDMSKGFPLLTTKKVFTKGIIHELLWLLAGDTNIKYLEDNGVTIWTSDAYREYNKKTVAGTGKKMTKEEFSSFIRENEDFAKMFGDLGPVYGAQWRNWGEWKTVGDNPCTLRKGIDQVQDAMNKLINNPDDRRIIVSAWNVGDIDKMALPPCHYMFQLYSEELTLEERFQLWFHGNKPNRDVVESWEELDIEGRMKDLDNSNIPKRRLTLIWDQRSCDTFLGIPFNIASYGILLHMFAQQANMVPGQLIGSLKNVHIYNNHKDQCLEQISREPRALPKLILNKAKDIFSYTYSDIKFIDYSPHEAIKGEISV